MYKINRNKKAETGWGYILALILGLFVIVVIIMLLVWPSVKKFLGVSEEKFDESDYEMCKANGERYTPNVDYNDVDNDKYPDDCDICVCPPSTKDGVSLCDNLRSDKDKDKKPEGCEDDDNNPDSIVWNNKCKDIINQRIKDGKKDPYKCTYS